MKMLIAFQKNSQNREATQAGGERGGWMGGGVVAFTENEAGPYDLVTSTKLFVFFCFFKDTTFVYTLASFENCMYAGKIATVPSHSASPTFGTLNLKLSTESKPSYSASLLFSRLYSITPEQGHAQPYTS